MIATLHAQEPTWSLRLLCQLLGVARSSYGYTPGGESAADMAVRDALANHKRVLALMHAANLVVHVRSYCRTTHSTHPFGRFPNLVRALCIERPDQVWCADITYVRLPRGFVYVAVVLDIFTRAIRGWELSRELTTALPQAALERALTRRRPEIHHSDQGVQYAAASYIAILHTAAIAISMADIGKPTQNAFAERLMRTLKEEEVSLHDYQDITEARARIGHFLDDVYMTKRVHSSLGYQTPAEFEAAYAG